MSCHVTSYTPVGNRYWCGEPDYGSRTCTETIDCPRGGLGGTYKLACRGTERYTRRFYCQNYNVCYECVGSDGCVFTFCEVQQFRAGYRETIREACDALENCPDCPEYPNRPGDTGNEGDPDHPF